MELQAVNDDRQTLAKKAVLTTNNLIYNLTPDTSAVVSRVYTTHQPVGADRYSASETAIILVNSGSSWLYGRDCYIELNVAVAAANATFLNGSAWNLIESIVISSRSGDEIERINNVNLFARHMVPLMASNDTMLSTYTASGFPADGTTATTIASGQNATFILPLSAVSGLFSCKQLLPSFLCAGLRIEINFSTNRNALAASSGAVQPTFTAKPTLHTQAYTLTDAIAREMAQQAAAGGLTITFPTYWSTSTSTPSASTANILVQKSVSRALGVYHVIRSSTAAAVTADNLVTSSANVVESQSRLGSIYMPTKANKYTSENDAAKMHYAQLMASLGKMTEGSSVSFKTYSDTSRVIGCSFERSAYTELSGVPTSNSRAIETQLGFADAATRSITTFLMYTKLIKVFLNNTSIAE